MRQLAAYRVVNYDANEEQAVREEVVLVPRGVKLLIVFTRRLVYLHWVHMNGAVTNKSNCKPKRSPEIEACEVNQKLQQIHLLDLFLLGIFS